MVTGGLKTETYEPADGHAPACSVRPRNRPDIRDGRLQPVTEL